MLHINNGYFCAIIESEITSIFILIQISINSNNYMINVYPIIHFLFIHLFICSFYF